MSFEFTHLAKELPALQNHARISLFESSSALHPLPALGERLGIQLDIKRDDTLPLAMGGNKVRQLEYYLGPAREMGADTVLITGAVQSNFVRLGTAAARKMGWHPIVQLEARVPKDDAIYNSSGNVLLCKLMGAEIIHFHEGDDEAAADANLDHIADERRAAGATPYVVHLGINHPPIGALGYAAAAVETWLQYKEMGQMPDCIVIPTGSGLTHAGFLAGARAIGWDVPVYGICVRRDAAQQKSRIIRRVAEVEQLLGGISDITDADINVDDSVLSPGYGLLNPAVSAAIHDAAHDEAILLDPVYTGRAMAGLFDMVQKGTIRSGQRVAFIHTGGTPGIFGYQNDLLNGLTPAIETNEVK